MPVGQRGIEWRRWCAPRLGGKLIVELTSRDAVRWLVAASTKHAARERALGAAELALGQVAARELIAVRVALRQRPLAGVGAWRCHHPAEAERAPRPKVGEMIDEPCHIPEEALRSMNEEELRAWGAI